MEVLTEDKEFFLVQREREKGRHSSMAGLGKGQEGAVCWFEWETICDHSPALEVGSTGELESFMPESSSPSHQSLSSTSYSDMGMFIPQSVQE